MFALIQAAGWPILAHYPGFHSRCSHHWGTAMGFTPERGYARDLLPKVLHEYRKNGVSADMLERLQKHSPLGQILPRV